MPQSEDTRMSACMVHSVLFNRLPVQILPLHYQIACMHYQLACSTGCMPLISNRTSKNCAQFCLSSLPH